MAQNRILVPGKPLSFSQYFDLPFTLNDILSEFGIGLKRSPLTLPIAPAPAEFDAVLASLQHQLARNRNRIELANEMARREALISPILLEVADLADQRIDVEYSIAVNEHLKGTVDYYIPGQSLLIIEAKQSDLVRGFKQLAVELIALDRWTRAEDAVLYGIVTTGEDWRFGLLDREAQVIGQDDRRYRVPEELAELLQRLLGVLQPR